MLGDSPLVQVVYRTQPLSPAESGSDVLYSLGNTVSHLLTGLHIAFGTCVVGIVEGPGDMVLDQIEKLNCEKRVPGLNVLREAEIEKRRFEGWSTHAAYDGIPTSGDAALANLFAERLSRALYSHT